MRLIIADDHAIVREGLKALFEKEGDIEVVGEASNGEDAVQLVRDLAPDVAIIDIAMPKLNGVEAIRHIRAFDTSVKTVVLSMHAENTIVGEALKAGCHSYVLKSSLFEEISMALNVIAKGERYLSPEITTVIVQDYLHPDTIGRPGVLGPLSSRERQVLQMVAEGLSAKEIAHRLHISPKTADATRRNIMQKLDVHTVAGLTKFAIREGLSSLEF